MTVIPPIVATPSWNPSTDPNIGMAATGPSLNPFPSNPINQKTVLWTFSHSQYSNAQFQTATQAAPFNLALLNTLQFPNAQITVLPGTYLCMDTTLLMQVGNVHTANLGILYSLQLQAGYALPELNLPPAYPAATSFGTVRVFPWVIPANAPATDLTQAPIIAMRIARTLGGNGFVQPLTPFTAQALVTPTAQMWGAWSSYIVPAPSNPLPQLLIVWAQSTISLIKGLPS